ncbi:helix-turn-helix transcriptional regulator [Streptomyces anulatus]|uniref:helix-turn-helix domain-containing protein n=1 Tax=Streptomyces anulatus TaxID=1892 RepID=UPI00343C0A1B
MAIVWGVIGMTLGQKIKDHRINLGKTMEEYGKRFEPPAHKSIVSKWEKDISKPNVRRLKLIADDMNITVTELLNGSDKT